MIYKQADCWILRDRRLSILHCYFLHILPASLPWRIGSGHGGVRAAVSIPGAAARWRFSFPHPSRGGVCERSSLAVYNFCFAYLREAARRHFFFSCVACGGSGGAVLFSSHARAVQPGGALLLVSIPGAQLQPVDGVFPHHVCVRAAAWRCLGMAMQQPDGTFFCLSVGRPRPVYIGSDQLGDSSRRRRLFLLRLRLRHEESPFLSSHMSSLLFQSRTMTPLSLTTLL
jgi:hypothetical protein